MAVGEANVVNVLPVTTAIAAAAFSGLGFVLQQRAASRAPAADQLRLRLLLRLVRQRTWVLGIAVMVMGQLLGAASLGRGDLALVEPFLATNLVFALTLSAMMRRRRPRTAEVIGAVLMAGGLGGFVVVASPHGGRVLALPWPNWAVALSAAAAITASVVAVSRRRTPAAFARNVGAAAGLVFGVQDALTRRTLAVFPQGGPVAVIEQWPTYVLVVSGVCALVLAQSAFEAAPLPTSLPPMTFAEPVTGIVFGAGVYAERIAGTPLDVLLEVISLLAAALGVWLVATSRTLASAHVEAIDRPYPPGERSRSSPDSYSAHPWVARKRHVTEPLPARGAAGQEDKGR